MQGLNSPGRGLVKSAVTSNHALDLIDKVGEVGIDKFLDPGLIKDLPLLGIAVSMHRAGNQIMAQMFAKKILKFLAETDQLAQDQRDSFYQKLSAKEAESLGETTLMLLDRCDSELQAVMLGRAFVRLMEGTLTGYTYELYGFIIRDLNRYYVQQIQQIYATPGFIAYDVPAANYLAIHGIVDVVVRASITNGDTMHKSMNPTPFGKAFYSHVVKG